MSGEHDHYEHDQATIRALADGARMPPERASRIERDLLKAFGEHHAAPWLNATRAGGRGRWRPWLGAAAAVITLSVCLEIWREVHVVTEINVTTVPAPAVAFPEQGLPSLAAPGGAKAAVFPVETTKPSAGNRNPSKRPVPRILRPSGFVLIPGTAALPQFESGTIMRIELPVASLPAYGVDISPAADDQPVEADVLVGQDGQARAIRLVTHSSRSSQ